MEFSLQNHCVDSRGHRFVATSQLCVLLLPLRPPSIYQADMFAPPVIFTTFCGQGNNIGYTSVPDVPTLKKVLDAKLQEYNESNPMMDLVLFDQAMVRRWQFRFLGPERCFPHLPCLPAVITSCATNGVLFCFCTRKTYVVNRKIPTTEIH